MSISNESKNGKIEKKEQISIDDDEKGENASIENSFMEKVKIRNEFEGEPKKLGQKSLHSTC